MVPFPIACLRLDRAPCVCTALPRLAFRVPRTPSLQGQSVRLDQVDGRTTRSASAVHLRRMTRSSAAKAPPTTCIDTGSNMEESSNKTMWCLRPSKSTFHEVYLRQLSTVFVWLCVKVSFCEFS